MRKKVFLLAFASLFAGIVAAQDKNQGKIDFDFIMIMPEDVKAALGPDNAGNVAAGLLPFTMAVLLSEIHIT